MKGGARMKSLLLLAAGMLLAGCGAAPDGAGTRGTAAVAVAAARPTPDPAALARLGRQLFFDTALSASGRQSCASCHNPAHAYAPDNALATQFGGPALATPGLRAVPSLRYALNRTPHWSREYQSNALERITETDSVPTGGLARDGRFDTLHDQARAPLLAANEMANADAAAIAAKLRKAPYAAEFRRVFGPTILDQPEQAFAAMLNALERFQLDDASFHPYTSKYDLHLQGKARLSAAEQRGLKLFIRADKGNCASCHSATPGADGTPPLFTDFTFANLGLPRNPRIAANANPRYYDLGLCGPERKDQAAAASYCGMFKTPTLRNVATRKAFMHNGVFTGLADAVRFYATRDSDPARWYPRKAGRVDRYNDLPADLRENVDVIDAPFNRPTGARPALNESEVQDIVRFLHTLTDSDAENIATKANGG